MSVAAEIRELQLRSASYAARHRRKAALACQLRLRPLVEKQLRLESRMDKREQSLIGQMVTLLVERGSDLGDERTCMRDLRAAEFRDGDIVFLLDRVLDAARVRKAAFAMPGDVA